MERYALITGASGGTGLEIARRFAKEGWNVVVTSRRKEEAEAVAKTLEENFGIKARGVKSSAGNEAEVTAVFDQLKADGWMISALVLNAAHLGIGQTALDVPLDEWREVLETIHRLNRESGMTVILITHYMDEAAQADRVVVMDSGTVIADGTPKEVFSQVELIRSAGLDVPQTTDLVHWLRTEKGLDLPADCLTVEEAADAVAKLFS